MNQATEALLALQQARESGIPSYLLVDPIMGDLLPDIGPAEPAGLEAVQQARANAWSRPVHIVPLWSQIKLDPVSYPYLVALNTDDGWLATSVELAWAEREQARKGGLAGKGTGIFKVGGWLQTSADPEAITTALAAAMQLRTVVPVKERYLRLADTRVLGLVSHLLGPSVLMGAIGCIKRWWYLDADGALQTLARPVMDQPGSEASATIPSFNQAQWQALGLGPLVHSAVAKAFGQRRRDPAGIPDTWRPCYPTALEAARRFQAMASSPTSPNNPLADIINTDEDMASAVALTLLTGAWEGGIELADSSPEGTPVRPLARQCLDIYDRLRRDPTDTRTRAPEASRNAI